MTAAVLMLPVAMGTAGWLIDRARKSEIPEPLPLSKADHLTIVAERMGPPVDWVMFEERLHAHLKDNPWRPISDALMQTTWEACMDWTGYGTSAPEGPKCELCGSALEYDGFCTPCHLSPLERQVDRLESEKIELENALARTVEFSPETEERLVCRRCHEPMGRDVHEAGDTHGPTYWIDYPHHRSDEIRSCRGMLVLERGPAPIPPLNCSQCGKPMYGVSGEFCGMCIQINATTLETLRRHKVPEKAISELSMERLHEIANYLDGTTPEQRSPLWFQENITLLTTAELEHIHDAAQKKLDELGGRAEARRPNRLERLPPR